MFLALAIISTLSSEQLLIFSNSSFSIFWSPGMATSTMRHFLLACLVNNSHIRSVMFNDLVSLGLIYPTFSGLWSYKLLTTSNPYLLARTPSVKMRARFWSWRRLPSFCASIFKPLTIPVTFSSVYTNSTLRDDRCSFGQNSCLLLGLECCR